MPNEFCPLPGNSTPSESELIAHMLGARRIAVVGASDRPNRPANYVPSYMLEQGYEIIPVNPQYENVWGFKSYKTVAEIPGKVDLVNVFRRSEFIPDVVRDAIAAQAGGVWVQSGIFSDEARKIAQHAGMPYLEDRCIMMERMHRRRR